MFFFCCFVCFFNSINTFGVLFAHTVYTYHQLLCPILMNGNILLMFHLSPFVFFHQVFSFFLSPFNHVYQVSPWQLTTRNHCFYVFFLSFFFSKCIHKQESFWVVIDRTESSLLLNYYLISVDLMGI